MMEILARMAKIQMTDFAELWFVFLVLYICPFTFLLVLVFVCLLKIILLVHRRVPTKQYKQE